MDSAEYLSRRRKFSLQNIKQALVEYEGITLGQCVCSVSILFPPDARDSSLRMLIFLVRFAWLLKRSVTETCPPTKSEQIKPAIAAS